MFERQLYLRCLLPVIGLWVTAVALAQSNQPIDVEENQDLHYHRKAALPVAERAAQQQESPVERRLTRITRRLTSAQAARPVGVSLPVTPLPEHPPEAESSPLGAGPEAQGVVALADPIERQPLGKPRGRGATRGSVPKPVAIDTGWLLRTLVALGAVIGCILLVRMVLSRMAGRATTALANSPLLEVLARISIGPRKHILLIRMGRRIVVVADSAAGLSALANIDDADEVANLLATVAASKGSVGRGFTQLLDRFNGEYPDDLRRVEEGADASEHRVDRARDQVSSLLSRLRNLNVTKRGGTV